MEITDLDKGFQSPQTNLHELLASGKKIYQRGQTVPDCKHQEIRVPGPVSHAQGGARGSPQSTEFGIAGKQHPCCPLRTHADSGQCALKNSDSACENRGLGVLEPKQTSASASRRCHQCGYPVPAAGTQHCLWAQISVQWPESC